MNLLSRNPGSAPILTYHDLEYSCKTMNISSKYHKHISAAGTIRTKGCSIIISKTLHQVASYVSNIHIYFIIRSEFNAYQMWIELVFFYSEKILFSSLAIVDTVYIFTGAKTRLSWQFWDWYIFQKVIQEGCLSEIMLHMLWRQHQT